MAMVRKRHASVLATVLWSAMLPACAEDAAMGPAQPVGMGGSGLAGMPAVGSDPTAGSGGHPGSAGMIGVAGRMAGAGSGGMTATGMGGTGMAGMMAGTGGIAGGAGGMAAGAGAAGMANAAGGMAGTGEPVDPSACAVGPITDEVRSTWRLDPFYTRYGNADGIPIVATDEPEDEAIRRACQVVMDLSSKVANARETMRTNRVYFIMMAKTEKTVQTPEYRSRGDLDARARGFGNNPGLCAEENVMCDRTTDRWRGESICVHEYAHVMHLYVWNRTDPQFNSKVTAAYDNAVRTMRLYGNTYAASNATEYFGEIVQDWYNTNLEASASGNGVHNHINTRAELEEYDPMGYALLEEVLPDVPAYKDCYYYE